MKLPVVIPDHAEVISAIGDALSHVRTERERAMISPSAADVEGLIGEVEADAVAAGASAASLETRVEHLTDRDAVRVTCTGSVGLSSGAMPGRASLAQTDADALVRSRGLATPAHAVGSFWLGADSDRRRVMVFDRYGDVVLDAGGDAVPAGAPADILDEALRSGAGSLRAAPDVWVVSGTRVVQVPDADLATLSQSVATYAQAGATMIIGRE
jgi:hypothetical protein